MSSKINRDLGLEDLEASCSSRIPTDLHPFFMLHTTTATLGCFDATLGRFNATPLDRTILINHYIICSNLFISLVHDLRVNYNI